MEHARGLAQANAYGPSPGKDTARDELLGAMGRPAGNAQRGACQGRGWARSQ